MNETVIWKDVTVIYQGKGVGGEHAWEGVKDFYTIISNIPHKVYIHEHGPDFILLKDVPEQKHD